MDSTAKRLREVYANYAHGDFFTDADIWHEDIELVFGDTFLESGVHKGFDGLPEALGSWLAAWDRWEVQLEELRRAPDGRIVALVTFRGFGRGSGTPVETSGAHIWTFGEDGLCTRMEIHATRAEADAILG